jgi:hypothetical protein
MKPRVLISDVTGTFFENEPELDVAEVLNINHPGIVDDIREALEGDNLWADSIRNAYTVYNRFGIRKQEHYNAVKEVIDKTKPIWSTIKFVESFPSLELLIPVTGGSIIPTFLNMRKYVEPYTKAKIAPLATLLEEDKYGVIKDNPFICGPNTRNIVATDFRKEATTIGIADEGGCPDHEYLERCHAGVQVSKDSKKGYQRQKGTNLFYNVNPHELSMVSWEIQKLPNPSLPNGEMSLEKYFPEEHGQLMEGYLFTIALGTVLYQKLKKSLVKKMRI